MHRGLTYFLLNNHCMASVLSGHPNIIHSSSTGLFLMVISDRFSHQLIQYDQKSLTLGYF